MSVTQQGNVERGTKELEIDKNDPLFIWAMRVKKNPMFRSWTPGPEYCKNRDEVRVLLDLSKYLRWLDAHPEEAEQMRKEHLNREIPIVQFQTPVLA